MEIPVEKNKEYIVDIVDNGFEGEGIAKIDNFTIFIPNAIKGEKIKILIVKVLPSRKKIVPLQTTIMMSQRHLRSLTSQRSLPH